MKKIYQNNSRKIIYSYLENRILRRRLIPKNVNDISQNFEPIAYIQLLHVTVQNNLSISFFTNVVTRVLLQMKVKKAVPINYKLQRFHKVHIYTN